MLYFFNNTKTTVCNMQVDMLYTHSKWWERYYNTPLGTRASFSRFILLIDFWVVVVFFGIHLVSTLRSDEYNIFYFYMDLLLFSHTFSKFCLIIRYFYVSLRPFLISFLRYSHHAIVVVSLFHIYRVTECFYTHFYTFITPF